MSGGEEIELKLLLPDAQALERLEQALRRRGAVSSAPVRQINHFFDSPERALRRGKFSLRLREEAGRYILTAKGPSTRRTDRTLHVRAEEEIELAASDARRILDGDAQPVAFLAAHATAASSELVAHLTELSAAGPLVHVGTFENTRTRVGPVLLSESGEALVMELDRTDFPNAVEHYEVELELPAGAEKEGRALLATVLAEADVEGRPTTSKLARFFELA